MKPPENLVVATILLWLLLPMFLLAAGLALQDAVLTARQFLARLFLLLVGATLIGGLALFLTLKLSEFPPLTPNVLFCGGP